MINKDDFYVNEQGICKTAIEWMDKITSSVIEDYALTDEELFEREIRKHVFLVPRWCAYCVYSVGNQTEKCRECSDSDGEIDNFKPCTRYNME